MLAEMHRQFRYATLESHILADGVLYLRCRRCKIRPVPHYWQHFMWCDQCLEEERR